MDYKDKLTATGEYHSGSNNWNLKHEESLIENWKQIIIQLGELYVHAKLCCWDVRTTEIYYHKATCFMKLKNRYRIHQRNAKQSFLSVMHGSRYPIWYITLQNFLLTSVTRDKT